MEPLDFELGIASIAGGDYEVSVLRSPAGEAHATMRFPFDGLELQTRLQALEIALLRSGGTRRQLDSTDGQKVRDFGRDLFDALIQGDVRSRFTRALPRRNAPTGRFASGCGSTRPPLRRCPGSSSTTSDSPITWSCPRTRRSFGISKFPKP